MEKHAPGPAFPRLPLLPCPFCGSAAKWFRTGRDVGVECSQIEDCHGRAQTDVYEPEHADAAAGRWNHRDAQAAELYEQALATRDELLAAAEEARAVLSELYAKYQTKIGPFASQAQRVNVLLGAAIAKTTGRQS